MLSGLERRLDMGERRPGGRSGDPVIWRATRGTRGWGGGGGMTLVHFSFAFSFSISSFPSHVRLKMIP